MVKCCRKLSILSQLLPEKAVGEVRKLAEAVKPAFNSFPVAAVHVGRARVEVVGEQREHLSILSQLLLYVVRGMRPRKLRETFNSFPVAAR